MHSLAMLRWSLVVVAAFASGQPVDAKGTAVPALLTSGVRGGGPCVDGDGVAPAASPFTTDGGSGEQRRIDTASPQIELQGMRDRLPGES